MEEICDEGPCKGHRYNCHVFVCSGGCGLPAGYCDCDKAEREAAEANAEQ
jgi:hypothetical protein